MSIPSPSRANKAGDRLRRMYADPSLIEQERYETEMGVLSEWRGQFQMPLTKTTMSLRSAVATVTGAPVSGAVFERFKREDAILAKLIRHKTRLSLMEDIAGCRAVLPDLDSVYAVRDRLVEHSRTLTFEEPDDYNEDPRLGGYRALHLHAFRDGSAVEIQLRTLRQQAWAETVETWDSAYGHDIKHENGPEEVVEAFRIAADVLGEQDRPTGQAIWANLKREESLATLQRWIDRGGRADD